MGFVPRVADSGRRLYREHEPKLFTGLDGGPNANFRNLFFKSFSTSDLNFVVNPSQ